MRLEVTVPHDIYNVDRNWFADVIQELDGLITTKQADKEGQKFMVLFFCDEAKVIEQFIKRYPILTVERC